MLFLTRWGSACPRTSARWASRGRLCGGESGGVGYWGRYGGGGGEEVLVGVVEGMGQVRRVGGVGEWLALVVLSFFFFGGLVHVLLCHLLLSYPLIVHLRSTCLAVRTLFFEQPRCGRRRRRFLQPWTAWRPLTPTEAVELRRISPTAPSTRLLTARLPPLNDRPSQGGRVRSAGSSAGSTPTHGAYVVVVPAGPAAATPS